MKKILVTVVLGVAALAAAQDAAPPAQGQPPAPTTQAPVIKDPAEYNAYVSAIQQKDPAALISGMEAFLTQYPNSIMKAQSLEILMGAYQQTGNPKVMDAAKRLLAVNPDNAKALVVLSFSERAAQKWADAEQHAAHGLEVLPKWTKPDGVSDADFAKQKAQFTGILNSVAGFPRCSSKTLPQHRSTCEPRWRPIPTTWKTSIRSPSPLFPHPPLRMRSMDCFL